ncbi:MAG: hypothetical protein ABI700_05360 [Chloroflexota bacterium]
MNTATIILCGGPINYSNLPIGTNQSNAMIPVNGKPVISWILDDLLAKQIDSGVVIVLREQDQRLRGFLQRAYGERMALTLAPLHHDGTIIQSLQAGLAQTSGAERVRVILGDTLIRDPYTAGEDFVYVGEVEYSQRWCLALTDSAGIITDYIDKQDVDIEPKRAVAGFYHFLNGAALAACVEASIAAGDKQLSAVLRRYGAYAPLKAQAAQDWYDFGNLDHLIDARRRLIQPRHFNRLTIDPVLNTITKISENNQKLRDELDWYLDIPEELKVLTPRILSRSVQGGQVKIVQEYYGYPTLAELFLYADLSVEVWHSILRHIFRVHDVFRHFPGQLQAADVRMMYVGKTWARLDELGKQSEFWAGLLKQETIQFNGRKLAGIQAVKQIVEGRAEALVQAAQICIVHGDLCFSNILFDINNQIIRLIDPRGSFGQRGIYGDVRYDIAKLRHSVCGLYDYIVADIFDVKAQDGGFVGEIFVNETNRAVADSFDKLVAEAGYAVDDIRLIEALLFLSMTPLHQDHPKRQLMMFLTGLSLLDEVLTEKAESP